jgi:murein DD-endopeptidase MepM/ murein hydrolase activator NlpD
VSAMAAVEHQLQGTDRPTKKVYLHTGAWPRVSGFSVRRDNPARSAGRAHPNVEMPGLDDGMDAMPAKECIDMSTPQLFIEPHPAQQETVYYLPLAPESRDHKERLKIVISMVIRNIGAAQVTVTDITFSFPGSDLPTQAMEREQAMMDPEGGMLVPDGTVTWCNGSYTNEQGEKRYNQIYLDSPAPRRIAINVHCSGFTRPHTQVFDLMPWRPVAEQGFLMPFSVDDLSDDEYIDTSTRHWYNGGARGLQAYGHDMKIIARVDGEWTSKRGPSATQNSDIRVFGRKVRAMADGEIVEVVDGNPDNDYGSQRDDAQANYVRVRHGTLEVKYSHLKSNSIVVSVGQSVHAGQKIGEAGNSGNTSGTPHLHLEGRTVGAHTLRGFNFIRAWQLERSLVPTDGTPGRRVSMDRRGVCEKSAAIRPFSLRIPPVAEHARVEIEEMVAEVFGGVSRGGDGFVIVNGKLTRVPPRGIKAELLNAIVGLDGADELDRQAAAKSRAAVVAHLRDDLEAYRKTL